MDVEKALEPHLQCPICLVVPRDGVMLVCVNGHNLCAVCMGKIGWWRGNCPLGRCEFNRPIPRNLTVATIVKSFSFKWPCKHQTESKCGFEGSEPALGTHEAACRSFQCDYYCKIKIHRGWVIEHFGNNHKMIGKINVPGCDQVIRWLGAEDSPLLRSSDFTWASYVQPNDGNPEYVFCSFRDEEGQHFVWMNEMFFFDGPRGPTNIRLVHEKDYKVEFYIPVYHEVPNSKAVLREENKVPWRDLFVKTPIEIQGASEERWKDAFSKRIKTFGI